MHNNYFFIKKLCPYLERINQGGTITECFSQEKDELILKIENHGDAFYIRASMKPHLTFLTFPDNFQRARNNSIDLFAEIINEKVLGIEAYNNERAFKIVLTNEKLLFFKLYGSHANMILFQGDLFVKSFNQKLIADEEIIPKLAHKDFIISEEMYDKHHGDINKIIPTVGKVAGEYWNKYKDDKSYESLVSFINFLDTSNTFYIVSYQKNISLSLVKIGDVLHQTYNPIEACNLLYGTYISIYQINKEKAKLVGNLLAQIKKTERYIQKSSERLNFLENEARNEEIGHIIMANLHRIPTKITEIELEDFYHENHSIKIILKKDLNPQQNAEHYYKKAKNEWKEKAHIKDNIASKQQKIEDLKALIIRIDQITSLKELRGLSKTAHHKKKHEDPSVDELFRKIMIENFTVLIGKNSINNDLLTLKYANKEDIWLHARNVSGSHVVIKNIPGQKIPKSVIERVAEIAAYHSKAKNDTLTPVMYTFKKFVRKIKGAAPGSVIVDKEEVIMVQPKDY